MIVGFILTIIFLINSHFKIDEKSINRLFIVGANYSNNEILTFKDLSKPESLLGLTFNNVGSIKPKEEKKEPDKEVAKTQEPLIYIYNTHQTEEYSSDSLKEYNITPTVYMASNILKKRLEDYQIESIVEDENIVDVLRKNGWKYSESYNASYQWLENAKKKYPSLKYFIDLHRDSSSFTAQINDLTYAKMMFVVGMNHENYEKNEALAIKLNDYLKENYQGLMRDMFYGKRSRYNQHFNENTILIEVGGPNNSIDEVYNSICALADAISNVLGGI